MNAVAPIMPFVDRVSRLAERVVYRRAVEAEDRTAIFRLRYEGYLRDGGIGPNPTQLFSDPWDDAPNAYVIGMYLDGELASTVRIHVTGAGGTDAPAFEAFGDVLAPFVEAGRRIVDPTRFVISQRHARFGPEIPFLTLRLTSMAAEHFGAFGILATVREEHVVMYRRMAGHRAISEPRAYPLLNKRIVCMMLETQSLDDVAYRRQPFGRSTAQERRAVFGALPEAA